MRRWEVWTCGYLLFLAAVFVSMVAWLSLDPAREPVGPNIVSAWRERGV